MIEFIVLVITIASFAGVFVFGMLAASLVDRDKIGSLSRGDMRLFGPLVPEKVLTPRGLKWAKIRNLCVIIAFLVPIAFAIWKHK